MKLIIGFGNPGPNYNFTRHNFGFLALDFYAKVHQLNWQTKPKFFAEVAKDDEHDLLLIKPQTFYNDVGNSIQAVCNFYKIASTDILVICDDFNLDFGKLRFRERGSSGGNNGLKLTSAALGTEGFPRLRLGTANDELRRQIGDVDFVLSHFTDVEHEQLPQILQNVTKYIAEY